MKAPRTTYLITRIHGLRTHLIRQEDYNAMVKAKDLRDFIDLLMKTEYAEEISMMPEKEIDASVLEKVFLKKLVERAYFIPKAAPSRLRGLLIEYYRRFEIENIKRVIRSKHVGEHIEEGDLIPLGRERSLINFQALLTAKSVQEVIDLLRETVYSNISGKYDVYQDYKTPLVLEAYLDDLYYNRLWRKLDETISDRRIRRFFTIEVDLRNLLLILGMKVREVDRSFIEENVISLEGGLNKRQLSSLIKEKVEEGPNIINTSLYKKILIESIELYNKGLLTELENLYNRFRYQIIYKMFSKRQFDVGYVFYYINLCESEARNLVAISLCKELGVSEEKLKNIVLV